MNNTYLTLHRTDNQARGIGQYALDFVNGNFAKPSQAVLDRTELFHLDSIACAVSALACRTNAPTILRQEASCYWTPQGTSGAALLGSSHRVMPEKAVVANSSAAREWDSNGTNFGYNPVRGATRGEFGHNDFYPVVIAAAQQSGLDGRKTLLGMLALDEIRGRLAEVFALKNYKIDHVVHGAIASAAVYGALMGATVDQIESAIGMVVAHYIPFRAIRHGKQLSDSKGASAAISAEVAVLSMQRAMHGFVGPADIFRNPEAIFCLFERPSEPQQSPFDLHLTTAGNDFAIMGMHFKLGLYEHQSAGAIQGLIDLLTRHPQILANPNSLRSLRITIYEPAFSIIGDPAKRDPRTRQSADHSMVYIVATLLRKAYELGKAGWIELMLAPCDYDEDALLNRRTREIIDKIEFRHGGTEFDVLYPDGIPTTVEIDHDQLGSVSSGLVMYPEGHARNTSGNLNRLLEHKFRLLGSLAVADVDGMLSRFTGLAHKSSAEIYDLFDFEIQER